MDLGVTGFRIDSYLPSIIWKESASSMVPCFFAFLGIGLGHTNIAMRLLTELNGGFHAKNMEKTSINVLLGGSSHLVSGF